MNVKRMQIIPDDPKDQYIASQLTELLNSGIIDWGLMQEEYLKYEFKELDKEFNGINSSI